MKAFLSLLTLTCAFTYAQQDTEQFKEDLQNMLHELLGDPDRELDYFSEPFTSDEEEYEYEIFDEPVVDFENQQLNGPLGGDMPPKPDIWHAECNMMSTYALQPCNVIYPTFIEVVKSYSKVKIAPAMGRHRIKKKE